MGSNLFIYIVSLLTVMVSGQPVYAAAAKHNFLPGPVLLVADKGGNGKGNKEHGNQQKKKKKHGKDRHGGGSGDGRKVTICHVPPGNPGNAHTISVGAPALNAHLGHGDYTGACRTQDPYPQPPAPPSPVPVPPPEYKGSILVFKYHDLDQNGQLDDGEPGLNDWTITVYDDNGNPLETAVTHTGVRSGTPGWLSFRLPAGTYTACETLQEGWFNTEPAGEQPCLTVSVSAGEQSSVRFGNSYEDSEPQPEPETGTVVLQKYEDQNGDGILDPQEPGLNNWQFVVYDPDGNEVASDVTRDNRRGEAGWLRFELPLGEYRICEVLQEGWINTAPGGDEPCLPVTVDGARHGGGYDPDLSFGNTYGVEPPPQDLVSIEVFKYHDRNRNARFDPGEPGLNGWRIVLFDAQEQQVASAFTQDHPQTGAAGWVRFENLPAADYFICEKLQRGWVNTDPGGAFPCKHGNATTGSQTITGADGSERADAVTITVDDDRASAYRVTLISDTGNTWTYLVEELGGRDLSHWNLGLGECLEHLAGSTPGAETGNDGSTGFYGIKWNVGDGFSSGEFSITLDGSYAAATIDVLVKAGNGFATAAITGPDCSDGGNGADQQQDITIHLGNSRRDY